jgi:Planctomycete cytochrome C/WD domain, G-beta repeat
VSRVFAATYLLAFSLLSLFFGGVVAEDSITKPTSFIRDVAPILVGKCQACHGPKTAESNYRLDTFELLMKPGDAGTAPVTAGSLDDSGVYHLITAKDSHDRMPNNGGRLADFEIQTIANWIRGGAKFDGQNPAAPLRDQIPRDIPHPAAPASYPATIPIAAMTFTSDGKQLLVGGYHELLVWDPTSAKLVSRVGNIPQRTFGLAFDAGGSWLAVAGGSPGISGEVRLISWSGGAKKDAESKVLATSEDVFFDVAFRFDGKRLAASAADGSIHVFDLPAGTERLKINNHADWVTHLCFSPDGRHIATASRDKTAKIFDAETGKLLTTYSEHKLPVKAVAFTPDGKSVISAGGSGIHIWNVEDAKLKGELTGAKGDVYALLAGNENVLAAADRTLFQFKLANRTLIRSLALPGWAMSLAGHEASHRCSAGCFDGTVSVWDLKNGAMAKQFLAIPVALKSKK